MKIVAIGDIHGKSVWRKIVQKEPDFDVLVFIGDYWDSFDISFMDQLRNFTDIVDYKESLEWLNPNQEIVMLIGNHDWHYLPYIDCEIISGYQDKYSLVIKDFMEMHHRHFSMAYSHGDYLFSHAGISEKFLDSLKGLSWTPDDVARKINEWFKRHPNDFELVGPDPYGRNPNDTPIWIRPKALMNANASSKLSERYVQVFGHTKMPGITKLERNSFKGYAIDVLDTQTQYLIINDGVVSTRTLN